MSLADDEPEGGWTIFRTPEFPNHWAVVQWWVVNDDVIAHHYVAVLCDTLDEAREQIPVGTIRFPREEGDDPSIVEVWL